MELLQIEGEIEFYRPIPYFEAVKCVQTADVYLSGGDPLEVGLNDLDRFRQALGKLIEEVLTQAQAGKDIEPPYVRVRLTGGVDAGNPTLDYELSLHAIEKETPGYAWTLQWGDKTGPARDCYVLGSDEGVRAMKVLIEKVTAKWFALVQFQGSSVERRQKSQEE